MFILTIVFLSFKITTVAAELSIQDSSKLIVHLVLLIAGLLLISLVWFWLLPQMLKTFTVITNVSNKFVNEYCRLK